MIFHGIISGIRKKAASEQGMSPLSIVILILIMMLFMQVGGAVVSENAHELGLVHNSEQAFFLAESGLHYATKSLEENWNNWQDASLYPTTTFGTGSFDITIADDDDGDSDSTEDSNDTVVVTVQGMSGDANRYLQSVISKGTSAFDHAIYTTSAIDASGSPTITGTTVENASSLPVLDRDAAIALALANHDNGYAARADGNYFQGDFPSGGLKPDSLNGVIFIDNFPDGSPATLQIQTVSTTSASPAILIVMGDVRITGNLVFNGLLYVQGDVDTDVDLGGTSDITGEVVSQQQVSLNGSTTVAYDADMVKQVLWDHCLEIPQRLTQERGEKCIFKGGVK